MKRVKYISKFIAVAAVLMGVAGCGNTVDAPDNISERIVFGIGEGSRTPVTGIDQLQDQTQSSVFVYGSYNSADLTYYVGSQLQYNSTGIWSLASGNDDTWTSGNYNFWGWAYSPADATTTYISGTTPYLTVSNNGRTVSVRQPTTYDNSMMVDYMLSRQFATSPTTSGGVTRGPVVTLEMEHALSMVEVYIVKAPAMTAVWVDDIRLNNFYTGFAATAVSSHAEYGDGLTNIWQFNPTGTLSADYRIQGTFNGTTGVNTNALSATDDMETTDAKMSFIAVPQLLTSTCELYVHYWVQEGSVYTQHSNTFKLYNYNSWSSGKRTIYRLMVDTGIHLNAYIVDWIPVTYIQGTVLPKIE